MEENWLNIGKIGKPHGLRGFFYLTYVPHFNLDSVKVGDRLKLDFTTSSTLYYTVNKVKRDGGKLLLRLNEALDRTSMEKIRFAEVFLEKKDDEMDVVGRQVIDLGGENLGIVEKLTHYGASLVCVIKSQNKKETLELPFVEDFFELNSNPIKLKRYAKDLNDFWHAL